MRFDVPSTLLLGASVVSAAVPPYQQILGAPRHGAENIAQPLHNIQEQIKSSLSKPIHDIQEQLKTLSAEARQLWEEVSSLFPGSLENTPLISLPKKHSRRPDSQWDHIVRGSDVEAVWVAGANGEKEREIDGRLGAYDLRVKKVDPSALGIDPDVKQYSGYLDDNESDKHLFYCQCHVPLCGGFYLILFYFFSCSS